MRWGLAVLAALSLALAGCPPPPDPDALPAAAILLAFGRTRVDALDCKRNDCTDWFRVRVPAKGDLEIELRPAQGATEAMAVNATLIEPSGRQLGQASMARDLAGRPELRLAASVELGTYLFAIAAPGTRKRIDYRLFATFRAEPPPPARSPQRPSFRVLRTRVLEVEGKRNVLLEAGARSGIRSGQSGKLIDDGRVIGEIVVTEVFNDGSRARIEAGLSGRVTPRTVAEVQVPATTPQ